MARPTLPAVGAPAPEWTNTIRDAIYQVSDTADAALATGSGVPGVVQVDSFAGATDADKMSAALSYAAAQTYVPWVQLPFRNFNTGTRSYDWFYGMKICGAGVDNAPKNQELGIKSTVGSWQTSCGTGANSLLRASSTIQSVCLSNINFHAAGNTSQIVRATGVSSNGLYPAVFHNLSLYGGPYFFGNPSEKFLTTQMVFSGHWTVLGYHDTPFTIGGGDASLWMNGYLNSNSFTINGALAGGKPIVDLQGMGKTNIGYMYLTAEGDWVGLRVDGGGLDKSVVVYGGIYEGRSQSNLATRPVVRLVSGNLIMKGPFIGQVSSSSGTVLGAVEQQGGNLVLEDPLYYRGAATTAAFPLLYQTGGTAKVIRPVSAYGEQVRVRWSSGTTDLAALPANTLA